MTSTPNQPPAPHIDLATRASPLAVMLWAIYLACSWTWCIGMCMPVLLERDFGWLGFAVFAIPNCIGAAALGWVLATPEAAARFAMTHRAAARAFSLVTIAYQAYFLGLLLTFFPPIYAALLAGLFLLALAPWAAARSIGRVLRLAIATYAISLAAAAVLAFRGGLVWESPTLDPVATGLIWLAPISLFGFALCPYLDLTFLRARASLPPAPGRAAFTIGFGVFFAAMILLTFLARGPLQAGFSAEAILLALAIPYAVHAVCQLAFTIGLHTRELLPETAPSGARLGLGLVLPLAAFGAFAALGPPVFGLDFREVGYRVFLAAYGLVFPTYVWLIAIPTRDGHRGLVGPLGRKKLRVALFAIAIATPAFTMGFIARQEAYFIPGILVLVLSRLALPRPRVC